MAEVIALTSLLHRAAQGTERSLITQWGRSQSIETLFLLSQKVRTHGLQSQHQMGISDLRTRSFPDPSVCYAGG